MISQPINKEISGNIFDIQGLSMHDGPGCRTLIFLNGCTLNCFWCSNPEGLSVNPVPMHFASKCIKCNNCIEACSYNAIERNNGNLFIDRNLCKECIDKECVNNCYTDALKLSGYEISISKLLQIIKRDRQFWGQDGGITLTGGEPLFQINFAKEILKLCHDAYIHTAIETCGNVPFENYLQAMPYLDWIFYDLKHLENDFHKQGTGAKNNLILKNAEKIAKEFEGRLIFRLPLIPGFNDSEDNIIALINFLKKIKKDEINILPLHHLGREKYPILNKEYTALKYPVPGKEDLEKIQSRFEENNIHCFIGSNTPF